MIAETVDSFIVENGTMFMMVLSLAFSTFAFLSPLLLLSKTLTQKKKKISVLRPQTCYLGVPSWQMLFLTVIFFFFYGIKGQKSGDISRQTENHKFLNLKL